MDFFYLEEKLLGDIMALNRVIEDKIKEYDDIKYTFFSGYEEIPWKKAENNHEVLQRHDYIGKKLKQIKIQLIDYLNIKIPTVILTKGGNINVN